MNYDSKHAENVILLRGATLWLLVALVLAWCLVGKSLGVPVITVIFKSFDRLLQAHIDFLLMSALIFGIYAAKVALPWHVNWSIVIGAFTNSSLFLLMCFFPQLLGAKVEGFSPEGLFPLCFRFYMFVSISVTTYGFGRAAWIIYHSTFDEIQDMLPKDS